jgi:AcrR family transcriptional regulator
MASRQTSERQEAVSELKRGLILDAARDIFETDGIEGASIRAIAKRAGYTPGAIYFHFASKEDIYGALLDQSLDALVARVTNALQPDATPPDQMAQAGHGFFDFYAENPRDLDLGFYLFRGGMRPHGLGPDRDSVLNEKLLWALAPYRAALSDMGCDDAQADRETAAFFAHVSGVLLLQHTGRMSLFATRAQDLIDMYLADALARVLQRLKKEK